jgi:hypothetical protein
MPQEIDFVGQLEFKKKLYSITKVYHRILERHSFLFQMID